MEPSKFDELTKALATATSRRQALRRIGGILGGTALAGLFPDLAFASNSACTTFCNAVFGAETQAAGKCISDAAHGKGLCHTCGSTTPASSICCTRNSSGFCTSYSPTLPCSCDSSQCLKCDSSSGTCVGCPLGQTCQGGQCVTTTTTTTTPPPPLCAPGSDLSNFTVCGSQGGFTCYCATDVDGSVVCAAETQSGFCASCSSDAECGAGFLCLQASFCGQGTICLPPC